MRISRRGFIKKGITTGGALFVYFTLPVPVRKRGKVWAKGSDKFTHHYFMVTPENEFIFTMDKSEMGQGVITGQTTLFGEEIDIPPWLFQVKPAPVADIYGKNTSMGIQITGGSTSTNERWLVLRQAGADIRQLILQAASAKLGVPSENLITENGSVIHQKTKKRLTYGDLVDIAGELDLPTNTPLKDPLTFKYIGKDFIHTDSSDKAFGSIEFGIDNYIPGLKMAVVKRSPAFKGKVKSFNRGEIKNLPGVIDVFQISSGVAIVCEKYWQAENAKRQLVVEWETRDAKNLDTQTIRKAYLKAIKSGSYNSNIKKGEPEKQFDNANKIIEAEYYLPYLAHACMEPMNCTAWIQEDRCDIYVPTQAPTIARNWAARYLSIDREDVNVHTSKYLGGGFGRRAELDFVIEAVEISERLKIPVKVIWSREDDIKFSPMRPISVHRFRASFNDSKLTAWEHQTGSDDVGHFLIPWLIPAILPGWFPNFLAKGITRIIRGLASGSTDVLFQGAVLDYQIPNLSLKGYTLDLDVPITSWRSVGHAVNGFVVESFIDELAHAAGIDPYEFRRDLLPEGSRKRRVLELVAKKSNWNKRLPAGRFRGIAVFETFGTPVAQIAEVEVINNKIHVHKVHCAVDCGVAVNPGVIRKQMESGIIFGLSAALYGEITIKNGGVEQENFDDYPILRMSEIPEIQVYIAESNKHPTGVGEPGVPPIAAAVGNAVFMATGKRLRELPFRLSEV